MPSYLKHFVLQHEKCEKLLNYSARNNMIVHLPIYGLNTTALEPVLSESCRLLILRLIRMLIDFFDSKLCLDSFTAHDIFVSLDYDNVPRLRTGLQTVSCTPSIIDKNLNAMAQVMEKGILSNCHKIPDDLIELFTLMRNNGHLNVDLIAVHSSLIPLENVREYFMRMHKEYFDLKKSSPSDYSIVSQGIIFPADWECRIQSNKYLIDIYNKRPFQKKKNKGGNAAGGAGNVQLPAQAPTVGTSRVVQAPATKRQGVAATQLQPATAKMPQGQGQRLVALKHQKLLPTSQPLALAASSSTYVASASSSAAPAGGAQQQSWPQLKLGKYNAPGSDPCDEVVHYNRNGRVHGPEHGLSLKQVEIALKNIFKFTVSSFQKALHSVGKFNVLDTDTLIKLH